MTLCGWCEKRIWPFPWTHLAFRTNADGSRTEYHVRCYQYINRIVDETQGQYAPLESWEEMQARLRWEEEDRL